MRTRPSLVAGAGAAALALTACGIAAGTSAGTPGGQAASVAARQPTGIGVTDLKDLAQVKRDAGRNAVDPAGARQPQTDTAGLADLRDLAKLKRDIVWNAAGQPRGR
jgi:hypothetical protein